MKRTYSKLTLATLDKDLHDRTCGYWYLIQANGCAHKAFAKRENMLAWLERVGLKLTADLPEHGQHSYQRLDGEYAENMHMDPAQFYTIEAIEEFPQLDNGDYTLGKLTDESGFRTVHYLNPNVRNRPVFDYRSSREMVG